MVRRVGPIVPVTCVGALLLLAGESGAFAPLTSRVVSKEHALLSSSRVAATRPRRDYSPDDMMNRPVELPWSEYDTRNNMPPERGLFSTPDRLFDSDRAVKSAGAAFALVAMDVLFRKMLGMEAVSAVSSLAGGGALFAALSLSDKSPQLFRFLSPGATVLTKWLPAFLVPSLVALPFTAGFAPFTEVYVMSSLIVKWVTSSMLRTQTPLVLLKSMFGVSSLADMPATLEAIRIALCIGGGYYSYKLYEKIKYEPNEYEREDDLAEAARSVLSPTPRTFSDKTLFILRGLACVAGSSAALASTSMGNWQMINPSSWAFMLFATLHNYVFSTKLPWNIQRRLHPVLAATGLTWLSAKALAVVTDTTFGSVLGFYRSRALGFANWGAGDALFFLMGPALISLAVQLYDGPEQFGLKDVRQNLSARSYTRSRALSSRIGQIFSRKNRFQDMSMGSRFQDMSRENRFQDMSRGNRFQDMPRENRFQDGPSRSRYNDDMDSRSLYSDEADSMIRYDNDRSSRNRYRDDMESRNRYKDDLASRYSQDMPPRRGYRQDRQSSQYRGNDFSLSNLSSRVNRALSGRRTTSRGAALKVGRAQDFTSPRVSQEGSSQYVTPLSLGIELEGGLMSTLIKRNTTLPCRRTRMYTTVEDNQSSIEFSVFEGERPNIGANRQLGTFVIDGIKPARAGEPNIEVTFKVNRNGVLNVKARDKNTFSVAKTTIKAERDGYEEIDRMVGNAEWHRQHDKELASKVAYKNALEPVLASALSNTRNKKLAMELSDLLDWIELDGESASLDEMKARVRVVQRKLGENISPQYTGPHLNSADVSDPKRRMGYGPSVHPADVSNPVRLFQGNPQAFSRTKSVTETSHPDTQRNLQDQFGQGNPDAPFGDVDPESPYSSTMSVTEKSSGKESAGPVFNRVGPPMAADVTDPKHIQKRATMLPDKKN